MPCQDGLTCVAPQPSVPPGVVLDGWVGTCATTPTPPATPTPTSSRGGCVGEPCCDVTCGILPDMPCRDGLTCFAPTPSLPPGTVYDGGSGTCIQTPVPIPTAPGDVGGGIGDDCCDKTCGVLPRAPCQDGLSCVAPWPSVPPGVVLDGWLGRCSVPPVQQPTPTAAALRAAASGSGAVGGRVQG